MGHQLLLDYATAWVEGLGQQCKQSLPGSFHLEALLLGVTGILLGSHLLIGGSSSSLFFFQAPVESCLERQEIVSLPSDCSWESWHILFPRVAAFFAIFLGI